MSSAPRQAGPGSGDTPHVGRRAVVTDLVLPSCAYGAAAVWFTWPLAAVGADHVVTSSPILLNDLYLVIWILTWVGRALTSAPSSLFEGNVLHPSPNVVAGSEHLIGDMPLFLPVWLATDDAILALNVLTLASFVLGALAMHFLARRWTGSTAAGWVAGVAFAFAPWRADLGRAHLLQVQYLPLIAYGIDRAVATGRARTGALTAAVLALQVLCSYYLGYAAYVVVASFVVVWLVVERARPRVPGAWRALAIAIGGPLLVVVPLSIPYLLARSTGALSAPPTPVVAVPWEDLGRPLNVPGAFVGWGTTLLAVAAVLARPIVRRVPHDARDRLRISFLVVTALSGVLLAAGPEGILGGRIAPYVWLSAMVPGFGNLRVAARFAIVTSFAMSALAAYGVADAERRLAASGSRAAQVVVALAAISICASWTIPFPRQFEAFPVPTRRQLSPAHRWLIANGRGRPLIEVPMDPLFRVADARAMVNSTYHWLPLLNGYTGHIPPGSAFLLEHAQQLPSLESLQILVDCADLEWILVHRTPVARTDAWRQFAGARLVESFPDDGSVGASADLYQVTLPRRGECPGLRDLARTAAGTPVATVAKPRGQLTLAVPAAVPPHRELRVVLSLRNESDVAWPGTAIDPQRRFAVWYAWIPVDGRTPHPWRRILVPQDVAPGASISFAAWIAPPGGAGAHVLAMRAGQGTDPREPLLFEQRVEVRAPWVAKPPPG